MKLKNQSLQGIVYVFALVPLICVTGCAKQQSASAEQIATQFGTGPVQLPGTPSAATVPATTIRDELSGASGRDLNREARMKNSSKRFGFTEEAKPDQTEEAKPDTFPASGIWRAEQKVDNHKVTTLR